MISKSFPGLDWVGAVLVVCQFGVVAYELRQDQRLEATRDLDAEAQARVIQWTTQFGDDRVGSAKRVVDALEARERYLRSLTLEEWCMEQYTGPCPTTYP